jgi:hypothetical protein
MEKFQEGRRIKIDGAVKYGNIITRCVSNGTVIEDFGKTALVNIDYIDGDFKANVIVNKKQIKSEFY